MIMMNGNGDIWDERKFLEQLSCFQLQIVFPPATALWPSQNQILRANPNDFVDLLPNSHLKIGTTESAPFKLTVFLTVELHCTTAFCLEENNG